MECTMQCLAGSGHTVGYFYYWVGLLHWLPVSPEKLSLIRLNCGEHSVLSRKMRATFQCLAHHLLRFS